VQELQAIYFNECSFAKYIIDKTPDQIPDSFVSYRGQEIQYWLDHHPDVVHYGILDDMDEGLSERFSHRFIQVHTTHLLTDHDVEAVLAADPLTASLCKTHVLVDLSTK